MQQILAIFLDTDTIETLVEESMPWLQAWFYLLSFILACVVVGNAKAWMRERKSPVERMLRRRLG